MTDLEKKIQKFFDDPANEEFYFIDKDYLFPLVGDGDKIKEKCIEILKTLRDAYKGQLPEELTASGKVKHLVLTKFGIDAYYKWYNEKNDVHTYKLDFIQKPNGRTLKIAGNK